MPSRADWQRPSLVKHAPRASSVKYASRESIWRQCHKNIPENIRSFSDTKNRKEKPKQLHWNPVKISSLWESNFISPRQRFDLFMCRLKLYSVSQKCVWRFVITTACILLTLGSTSFGFGMKLMEFAEKPDITPIFAGIPVSLGVLGVL
jgi:hypothetical protein